VSSRREQRAETDEQVVSDSGWIIISKCLHADPILRGESRAEYLLTFSQQADVESNTMVMEIIYIRLMRRG